MNVSTHIESHVARIVFSRPPHNFACPELLGAIADELDAIDAEPSVRCSVLMSEGRSFCAGADLAGDDAMLGSGGMDTISALYSQAERLFRRKKPMVAAVQGAAIGAGLGLALTADFRVAAPRARFSSNFVALGFHPGFALTYTLPRLIGVQRASWMMLSAERVKPDAALSWGLVDQLAEESDLAEAACAMAQTIARNAPLALVDTRATANTGLVDGVIAAMRHEHEAQTKLKGTDDYAEGVSAVFERREAHFTGR